LIEYSSGWIASIPSPSFNSVDIGPLTFTLYGLMIGLGIIAATVLARARAPERNLHPDIPLEMLVWVVPAGLVGTRIYHIITDWVPISQWYKIWEGGLGIPGGIMAGAVAGILFTRRRGISTVNVADVVAPSLPLAQAIGRIGNWWNQELYGRPTELPWGLEIDPQYRRPGFEDVETFHPTFLYETLWNLGLVVFLLWLDRKRVLKPGRLIWVYAAGYAIGRLWIETVRIDNATEILGVRINIWMMSLVLIVSVAILSKSFQRQGDGVESSLTKATTGPHDNAKINEKPAKTTANNAASTKAGSTKTVVKKGSTTTKSTTAPKKDAAASTTASAKKNTTAGKKPTETKKPDSTKPSSKKNPTAGKKRTEAKKPDSTKPSSKKSSTSGKKPSETKKPDSTKATSDDTSDKKPNSAKTPPKKSGNGK